MPTINAGEFRKGIKVLVDGQPYEMLECQFVKPGKGQALYKSKLRNLLTGTIIDNTYRSGDGLEAADVRNADGAYSYFDGTNYIFMDNDSFEQVGMPADICADQMKFITEGTAISLMYWNEQLIGINPPKHIVLEIVYAEPAAQGNTATNVTKLAKVETGGEVQVPSFIKQGDRVKIDTADGSYLERVRS